MRRLPPFLAIAVLAIAFGAVESQAALTDLLCLRGATSRRVDRAARFTPPEGGLSLADRVTGPRTLVIDLRKPTGLCLGADGGTAAFEAYGARLTRTRPPQTKPVMEIQRVTNRFGSDDIQVRGLTDALTASTIAIDPPPAARGAQGLTGDLACYDAARANGLRSAPATDAPLTITTELGTWLLDVRAPTRLCFPADLDGATPNALAEAQALACYRAKLARTKPAQPKRFPRHVATANRFGAELLTVTATLDLCVVSDVRGANATPTPAQTAVPTPTPTLTPPPNFTLRVNPTGATVGVGGSARFTATAVFTNGDTADFTERVLWQSSSAAALAPNETGDRGRIDAVDGGTATISVLDEATGVTSSATGEDALLTIEWTLERIELLPVAITRGEGESFRLRATGHFTGGFTRSIAERLIYASSEPGVGLPLNDADPDEHSRVLAVAEGTATLSAVDPLSGISSTDSDDDVVLTVVPPLARCTILQNLAGFYTLETDRDHRLTARGFYPGGFERNVTQQVEWLSNAPTVLEAPNTEGDRSRVHGLTPGEAHVTAVDSVTGIPCEAGATFYVGTPSGLSINLESDPIPTRAKRAGRFWRFRAVEFFYPHHYSTKNVTARVTFASSNTAAVATPNIAGDRGRVDAVGSGSASITATDPVTGLVSNAFPLRSLDGLTRIRLPSGDQGPSIVDVGDFTFVRALGIFADGPAPLEYDDITLVSDNPSVLWVHPIGYLVALAPGFANVSVIDEATGISSAAFGESLRVAVRGPLERIELLPQDTTTRVTGIRMLTAIGHYAGGVRDVITQQLVYASSAPAIAIVPNDIGNRSLIRGMSPGTAVISATDPFSGVSSTDTGDDVTLTVLGPLTRLRIEPSHETRSVGRSFSFTAIGTDALGRELNVTQDVSWSTGAPGVAIATNPEGNRSRIDAVAEGTTTVFAYDGLDDISSADSSDNATFVVDGILASITLAAETTTVTAGTIVQVTATGHLVGGATINLTQQLQYSSSSPAVAVADNAPGDRSRVTTKAPGTTVISAHDPGTGLDTLPGGTVTLDVTAP